MDGSDQIRSAVVLGIVLVASLVLLLLIVWLARTIWRWVMGGSRGKRGPQKQEPRLEPGRSANAVGVSASDLFVIRSNLDAVSRQIEDLERRLRLEAGGRSQDVVSSRD